MASLSRDHLYVKDLFQLLKYDIGLLRLSNIVMLVCSSFILTIGLIKYCQTRLNIDYRTFSFFCAVLSSIVIAQLPSLWIERSPSYNNWGANLTLASIGIFLHWQCLKEGKGRYHLLMIGVLIGLLTFIRPPNSILLGTFISLMMLVFNQFRLKFLIHLIIGFLISIIFHFILIESPESYLTVTKKGFDFDSHLYSQHGLHLIKRYLLETFVTFKFSILSNKFELILFIFLQYTFLKNERIKCSIYTLYLTILIISIKHFIIGDCNGSYSLYWFQWRFYSAQIVVFVIATTITLVNKNKILKNNYIFQNLCLSIILLSSPLFFSFGTNNVVLLTMNFFTSLFIVGIFILVNSLPTFNALNNKYLHLNLVLLLLSFGPCFSYLHGRISSNYYTLIGMSHGNLFEFKSRVKVFDTSLTVSDATKVAYLQLKKSLLPFTPNLDYLINFTAMPGLNFLLNLPHPLQSWTAMMKDNFTLKNLSAKEFESSAIVLNSNDHKNFAYIQKYFPSFNTTHSLLSTTKYSVGDQNLSILLYIPQKLN